MTPCVAEIDTLPLKLEVVVNGKALTVFPAEKTCKGSTTNRGSAGLTKTLKADVEGPVSVKTQTPDEPAATVLVQTIVDSVGAKTKEIA